MKLFISWSGEKSKKVAIVLKQWLPKILPSLDVWISLNINKGDRWSKEIAIELEKTQFGIICLTKSNLDSNWILFESGALSKSNDSSLCTFLIDIDNPTDVSPPLGQFQSTLFIKEDIYKLVETLNKKLIDLKETHHTENQLLEMFEILWPLLEVKISEINSKDVIEKKVHRSDRELLEEILSILRSDSRTENIKINKFLFNTEKLNEWFKHDNFNTNIDTYKFHTFNSFFKNFEEE